MPKTTTTLSHRYTSVLHDLLRGIPLQGIPEEELEESFMYQAKLRWYEAAISTFQELLQNEIDLKLQTGNRSNIIRIDLPEKSPSGNTQILEIRVGVKVKE